MALPLDVSDFKTVGVGTLYAFAAIFGFVGGCGAGLHYLSQHRNSRLPFVLAYALIGAISGITYFAISNIYGIMVAKNIHELVLNCIVVGSACSLVMFTANTTVKFIFERFGIEVQITTRKDKEERRDSECPTGDSAVKIKLSNPPCPLLEQK